jgi:hypothetical protein
MNTRNPATSAIPQSDAATNPAIASRRRGQENTSIKFNLITAAALLALPARLGEASIARGGTEAITSHADP